jgi:hypothetical protein
MSSSRVFKWLGVVAAMLLVFVAAETGVAIYAGTWSGDWHLATLELTVVSALAVSSLASQARGRRVLELGSWTEPCGRRAWLERLALLWLVSLALMLGVLPGLALDSGQPAVWPVALVVLATLLGRYAVAEHSKRIAWLLCTTYGITASLSLLAVRHLL